MPTRPQFPGYVWDSRLGGSGRYRIVKANGKLGRIISAKEIQRDLTVISNASAERFGLMAADAVGGRITAAELQLAMQSQLKDLYNANAALARGGWSKMGPVEWGRNGQILRGEYRYLSAFAQEIADGTLTEAQAAARAKLYVGKAYSRYWAENELMQKGGGATESRWNDQGDKRECQDCRDLAAMGWVPIGDHGTVPGAGDTACLGHCRCQIDYR